MPSQATNAEGCLREKNGGTAVALPHSAIIIKISDRISTANVAAVFADFFTSWKCTRHGKVLT